MFHRGVGVGEANVSCMAREWSTVEPPAWRVMGGGDGGWGMGDVWWGMGNVRVACDVWSVTCSSIPCDVLKRATLDTWHATTRKSHIASWTNHTMHQRANHPMHHGHAASPMRTTCLPPFTAANSLVPSRKKRCCSLLKETFTCCLLKETFTCALLIERRGDGASGKRGGGGGGGGGPIWRRLPVNLMKFTVK